MTLKHTLLLQICKQVAIRMKQKARYVILTVTLIAIVSVTVLFRDLQSVDVRRGDHAHITKVTRPIIQKTDTLVPKSERVSREKVTPGNVVEKPRDARNNKTRILDVAIDRLIYTLRKAELVDVDRILKTSLWDLLKIGQEYRDSAQYLYFTKHSRVRPSSPNYIKFHHGIQKYSLYRPTDPAIDGLLHDMATQKFSHIEMMTKGTMFKLLVTFADGGKAVFKPMRWEREYETLPNQFYFNDFERHNSEIACFHLDRLLGFYGVPPVTGRMLNMTREIYMMAEKALKKTFYVSPIGNLCFYGECSYYCDSKHAFCGNIDQIEGSLMAYLPDDAKPLKWKSPYRRSYSRTRFADWEKDKNYCNRRVKTDPVFRDSKQLLLSFIDTHIFDFLTGNMDRHHVNLFYDFGNDSTLIHMDNGRGFGKTTRDEVSILAPLRQCCVVRQSTVLKLLNLDRGPERLSSLLDKSLKKDPLYPIVVPGHYEGLDRRVKIVLSDIANCVSRLGSIERVIISNPM